MDKLWSKVRKDVKFHLNLWICIFPSQALENIMFFSRGERVLLFSCAYRRFILSMHLLL